MAPCSCPQTGGEWCTRCGHGPAGPASARTTA
jgi:hypothetical protein